MPQHPQSWTSARQPCYCSASCDFRVKLCAFGSGIIGCEMPIDLCRCCISGFHPCVSFIFPGCADQGIRSYCRWPHRQSQARQSRLQPRFHKLTTGAQNREEAGLQRFGNPGSDQPSPCSETSAFSNIRALSSRYAASRPVPSLPNRPVPRPTTEPQTSPHARNCPCKTLPDLPGSDSEKIQTVKSGDAED